VSVALDALAGRHRGGTLLVVSCGPSARHWREVRSRLGPDVVVACVKQAIFLCGAEAEIHFFNPYNAQRFWPHNRRALRVDVQDRDAPPTFNAADLVFTLDPESLEDISRSVAATRRFEDHTIAKTGLVRPWGPGIMYDAVLHLAVHFGFGAIHTVGWDIVAERVSVAAERSPRIAHFYDPREPGAPVQETFEWLGQDPREYRRAARRRHWRGEIYNRVPKRDVQGEVLLIQDSLPSLAAWLGSEGVALTIHSRLEGNPVDPSLRPHVVDLTPSP
jgi:hypothetical protein